MYPLGQPETRGLEYTLRCHSIQVTKAIKAKLLRVLPPTPDQKTNRAKSHEEEGRWFRNGANVKVEWFRSPDHVPTLESATCCSERQFVVTGRRGRVH